MKLLTFGIVVTTWFLPLGISESSPSSAKKQTRIEQSRGFHDLFIVEQCQLLKAIHQDKKDTAKIAQISARLAGHLVERLRNKGKFENTAQGKDLTKTSYQAQCGQVIESLVGVKAPDQSSPFETHAQALLDFALARHQPNVADDIIMEIRKAQWLFYNVLDKHIQAENVARLAINSLIKSGNKDNYHRYFNTLISTSLMRQGRFAEALKFLREAVVIAERSSTQLEQSFVWFSLGFLYRDLGEYEVAERYFRRSVAVIEKIEGKVTLGKQPCREPGELLDIAPPLTQLGIILGKQGKHDQAKTYFSCALEIMGHGKMYYELVTNLADAQNDFYLGDYSQAINQIDTLLKVDYLLIPQKLDGLLVKLESLLKGKPDLTEAQSVVTQLANLLGYQDFYDTKNLAKNISDYPVQQVTTFRLLIELSKLNGQTEWLTPFSEKGFDIIKQYQHQVTNPQAWNTARYDLIKTYVWATYDEKLILDKNQMGALFELFEEYYSIDLSLEKNSFQAEYSNTKDQLELERLYQAWLEAERILVTSQGNTVEQRSKVDLARDAYLSYRSFSRSKKHHITKALSLRDVQKNMPSQDILVRYFINDDKSFVMFTSHDNVMVKQIPSEQEILTLSADLVDAIHGNNFTRIKQNRQLEKLLPLEGFIQPYHEKLVLIPDNVLHRIPFSVINLTEATGRDSPLKDHLQIVRTHSASQYYAKSETLPNVYASNMAVFANPLLALSDKINASVTSLNRQWINELGALPGSLLEAQHIRNLFPKQKINFGTGAKANKAFLTQPETRDAQILHIATHGYYQENTPDVVGLITSDVDKDGQVSPGFLSINELLSQPINSQLVVISGCDTMMGKYYKSSGMRSITRGFLAQGAQSVIGTLWPVQDKATAEFMRHFYQHLKNNQGNSAKALQLTKQQFAQRGRYRQPRYWAGFVLTANNQHAENLQLNDQSDFLTAFN